jgi:hypothetical protein
MQVAATQIRKRKRHTYTLWDGEMLAHVYRHVGVYGFCSAAIVIERMDDPLEVRNYNGYQNPPKPTAHDMDFWIAAQLTDLGAGKGLAVGTECDVVGLR